MITHDGPPQVTGVNELAQLRGELGTTQSRVSRLLRYIATLRDARLAILVERLEAADFDEVRLGDDWIPVEEAGAYIGERMSAAAPEEDGADELMADAEAALGEDDEEDEGDLEPAGEDGEDEDDAGQDDESGEVRDGFERFLGGRVRAVR